MYDEIRRVLSEYYFDELPATVERIRERVFNRMDGYYEENQSLSSYGLKAQLYRTIAEEAEVKVFPEIPYFFDTGVLMATSDGRYRYPGKDRSFIGNHANGWLYLKNVRLFEEDSPEDYDVYRNNMSLYCQTGTYVDIMHIGLPLKKVFSVGLRGILDELRSYESGAADDEAKEFYACAEAGILALRTVQKRFSEKAEKMGLSNLAEVGIRVPWEAPKTFYEGLFTMAFMRRVYGAFEGVGFNSFGRVDLLLAPLYESDERRGVSRQAQLDLLSKFLLIWDTALDRRLKIDTGFYHELENSLTLGGEDENGNQVYNEVTRLFLDARDSLAAVYPKMMLRFGKGSAREYLERICEPLLRSQSYSLLENDDNVIPALIRSGKEREDAVNYVVSGCWDMLTPEVSNSFGGEYLNMARALSWAIQRNTKDMERNRLYFEPLDELSSFDEVYDTVIGYVKAILEKKATLSSKHARVWSKVNPVCILSSLIETPIPKGRDLTAGGGKYNWETVFFSGFSEVADSLLVIKKLCFEERVCTLKELLDQCRCNWQDERLRQRAIRVTSYGDGTEESSRFAARLYDDLYRITRGLPTAYGGEYRIGYNQYTEIIWWGRILEALPNGRRLGDYISGGLSPSRLQGNRSITDVIESQRYFDATKCAGNSSTTLTIPLGKIDTSTLIDLLYAIAGSKLQALQPNCVDIETLRAAQREPQNYGHVIVRVCGFSAPFVLLSPEYQEEFISRMLMNAD